MIFREWKYVDIMRITQLENECLPEEKWSFQMFADSFSADNTYGCCAEENGDIIGYACISFGGDDADVESVAVSDEYRGNGVGKKLVQMLVQEAERRKAHKIFLEVRVSNAPAQILYLKQGFKGLYARPRYYSNGDDAIVMVKQLRK